jgi:hypothetical protein
MPTQQIKEYLANPEAYAAAAAPAAAADSGAGGGAATEAAAADADDDSDESMVSADPILLLFLPRTRPASIAPHFAFTIPTIAAAAPFTLLHCEPPAGRSWVGFRGP